jgi:hypothetical protein
MSLRIAEKSFSEEAPHGCHKEEDAGHLQARSDMT